MKEDSITSPCEGKPTAPVLVVQICRVPMEILGKEHLSLGTFCVRAIPRHILEMVSSEKYCP